MSTPPEAPRIAETVEGLGSVALISLIFVVLGILWVEGHLPWFATDLGYDVAEFNIRAYKFLAGTLTGTEYPPFAVGYFLLVHYIETFHVPYLDVFFFFNFALIGLHVALLNQVAGRRSALLLAVLLLAAGPILLYRFELLVSFLVLLAWHEWRARRPVVAGGIMAAAVLTKLYPLLLVPLFCLNPTGSPRWRPGRFLIGLGAGLALILTLFSLGGNSFSLMEGLVKYHEQKPVALESMPAVAAMIVSALTGSWPPIPINAFGLHGLVLPAFARLLPLAGLLASLGVVYWRLWRRRDAEVDACFIVHAQSLVIATVFWSSLFQPQYLVWSLALIPLLPLAGVPWTEVETFGALWGITLLSEQVIFPWHYSQFLAIFDSKAPGGHLFIALAVTKICLTTFFVLALRLSLANGGGPLPAAPNPPAKKQRRPKNQKGRP